MLTNAHIENIIDNITNEATACDAPHNDDETRAKRRNNARHYWQGYICSLLIWGQITAGQQKKLRDRIMAELA